MNPVRGEAPLRDLLLVLNGTEERLQIVLGRPIGNKHELLAGQDWTVTKQSLKFLAPAVDGMLRLFGARPADLARIACVRGPGGFTGTRLALAAAHGIAAGGGQLLAGLDVLPVHALGATGLFPGTLHVVTHSRRRQVYLQSFEARTGAPLTGPLPLTLEEAATHLADRPGPHTLLGTGIRNNREFFDGLLPRLDRATLLSEEWNVPRHDTLLRAASSAEYSRGPVEPLYLRPSDAEDNLDDIARKRGLDPVRAHAILARATGRAGS